MFDVVYVGRYTKNLSRVGERQIVLTLCTWATESSSKRSNVTPRPPNPRKTSEKKPNWSRKHFFLPFLFSNPFLMGWLALGYATFVRFNSISLFLPTQQRLETAKSTVLSTRAQYTTHNPSKVWNVIVDEPSSKLSTQPIHRVWCNARC